MHEKYDRFSMHAVETETNLVHVPWLKITFLKLIKTIAVFSCKHLSMGTGTQSGSNNIADKTIFFSRYKIVL